MNKDAFDPFGLQDDELPQTDNTTIGSKQQISGATGVALPQQPVRANGGILNDDSFDPFGIGELQQSPRVPDNLQPSPDNGVSRALSPQPPPQVSRVTRSNSDRRTPVGSALPPKSMVKLTVQEEVSSTAILKKGREGASNVVVDGTIYAQVQCSDANRNAPFALIVSPLTGLQVKPNPEFALEGSKSADPNHHFVEIPKKEIGYVPVAHYHYSDEIEHMPILLERKITIHETTCRIAVQVRSKLSNLGDMKLFTIAAAIPDQIDGSTISIMRGDGVWDDVKRTIMWRLPSLNRGESFMVSAQIGLWKPLEDDESLHVPVLVRCSSPVDQVSSIDIQVKEVDGHPASTTFNKTQSFRLLHRLS